MFSLSSLYQDYIHQSKEQLIDLIEHELSSFLGLGYASTISEIRKSIKIAEEYTNHHQKEPQKQKFNDKGELVRKSGEPYINHPLRVTLILIHERLFDEDVLKAAIMHDLYEDTSYSYEQAKEDFDKDVADLINCVTNVSEDQKQKIDDGISPEELDYAEIIRKCNEHKIAFYIKFADRLDNLMTLDAMPVDKQEKKIEDTRNYVFPLLYHFNATRFIKYIENAIFKIEESIKPAKTLNSYKAINDRLLQTRAFSSIEPTFNAVEKSLKKYFSEIRLIRPSIYEISKRLKDIDKGARDFSQSDLLYDIYLISPSQNSIPSLNEILAEFTTSKLAEYSIEEIRNNEFYFMDNIRNHYYAHLITSNDFNIKQYGDTDADLIIATPNDIYDKLVLGEMIVFTPKHEKRKIPIGSTVIDFAFCIHKELGEHMAGAIVNGKRVPLHTKLKPGDVVEIIKGEYPKPEVQFNWILYCETRIAKRAIYKIIKAQMDEMIDKINGLESNQ